MLSHWIESLHLRRSSRESKNSACSKVLWHNLAAVVPAQAGPHTHHGFRYTAGPAHIALAAAYGSPPARGRQRRVIASHLLVKERTDRVWLAANGAPASEPALLDHDGVARPHACDR